MDTPYDNENDDEAQYSRVDDTVCCEQHYQECAVILANHFAARSVQLLNLWGHPYQAQVAIYRHALEIAQARMLTGPGKIVATTPN